LSVARSQWLNSQVSCRRRFPYILSLGAVSFGQKVLLCTI
jgi:hypothetical protein